MDTLNYNYWITSSFVIFEKSNRAKDGTELNNGKGLDLIVDGQLIQAVNR